MTLDEIKAAVRSGRTVHWTNESYRVIEDSLGQWLIVHDGGGGAIGLTWRDGTTVNGQPADFFVKE